MNDMIDIKTNNKLREKYNPEGSVLREYQKDLLDILLYFDQICRDNNISYWLSGGTCLGAKRHGGFIPWDDDIDVEMTLDEFNRFVSVFCENNEYVLQTYDNDLYYTEPFSKLRAKHCIISEGVFDMKYNYRGPFIDIFALESVAYIPSVMCHFSVGVMRHYSFHIKTKIGERILRFWKSFNKWLINSSRVIANRLAKRDVLRYSYGTGCTNIGFFRDKIFPLSVLCFEGHMFPAPKDVDYYLTVLYGDYMSIPNEIHTHSIIESVNSK